MEFRQIEAFINVIKYKSFSKAADAAFLAQPTISLHISSLEKELGVILLDRKGKEILPTVEGQKFYTYAVNMIGTRDRAKAHIMEIGENPQGVVELQSSTVPAQVFLPNIMSEFRKSYNGVRFYLEQSDSIQVLENLTQGKGELGFVGEKLKENIFVYEEIFRDEDVLITSTNGKFAQIEGEAISVEEFINEPFVLRQSGSATGKAALEWFEKYGIKSQDVDVAVKANSTEVILNAVKSGLGVSIVSKKIALLNNNSSSLRIFSIEGFKRERAFYMVHSKNAILSSAGKKLKEFILEKQI